MIMLYITAWYADIAGHPFSASSQMARKRITHPTLSHDEPLGINCWPLSYTWM